MDGYDAIAVEVSELAKSRSPDSAATIFEQGTRRKGSAGLPIAIRDPIGRYLALIPSVQTIRPRDPNAAVPCCEYGDHKGVAQPLVARNRRDTVGAKQVKPIVRRHPDV